ncbi:PAS/PAC sensor signal transduction histidine kinase [Nitrosomonas aestuarii]|nr:PAS/PAC sensor signal transduction histidine kinase [Nitrosomonas aestuarii]
MMRSVFNAILRLIWKNSVEFRIYNTNQMIDIESSSSTTVDQEQLKLAFDAFNAASEQLSGVYQDLQLQVERLTYELALANGELHRQLSAKEALSQKLTLLLNALPGGVIALNANERVEQVNPAASLMLGDPLVNLSWQKITDERLLPTAIANEWNVEWQSGGNNAMKQRRIRIESSPADSAGRRILLIHDITEAYAMQEQIRRNQRLTSMGEMAANLAHQLRTPLSTALLYASHLGNDALMPGERQKFATKTIERLKHLEHLTGDMLRFVKGETAQFKPVEISALLTELQQVIEPQIKRSGMFFNIHDHSQGVNLMTDRKALCGAFINLLENAVQVSAVGDEITLSCDLKNNDVVFRVHDNGTGIDNMHQEHLFEPFFTTRTEGTGLGLAIVRAVVQSMGGSIEVNSTPQLGSEFIIRLPRTIKGGGIAGDERDAGGYSNG